MNSHELTTTSTELKFAVQKELERIKEDCTYSAKSHFNAGERWECYHYRLGIPSVVLSVLVGTALFKNCELLIALMSTLLAVFTALMTFLKPSERAAVHKSIGNQYLILKNDVRLFGEVRLPFTPENRLTVTDLEELLEEFAARRSELNNSSPSFSQADYEKTRKGIGEGEAAHEVDEGKSRV